MAKMVKRDSATVAYDIVSDAGEVIGSAEYRYSAMGRFWDVRIRGEIPVWPANGAPRSFIWKSDVFKYVKEEVS